MNPPRWLRLFLHRRGWIASPSLAYLGVPFGPDRRDLAQEVMAAISRNHNPETCPICSEPDTPYDPDEEAHGPAGQPPPCIPDHGVPVPCPGCDTP